MKRPPTSAVRGLHVFVLCAFALAQPLFDLLTRHAEFLVAHGAGVSDLVLLAFFLTLGIPGLLVAAKWALDTSVRRIGNAVHVSTVGLLVTAIALPILGKADAVPALALTAAAVFLGCAAAAAYTRLRSVQTFLTVLSPVLVVFPLLFVLEASRSLLRTPVSEVTEPLTQIESDVPVVVVVFDSLPLSSLLDESGRIDRVRYPHFADLAAESHWFRNATTVAERTSYALPAILTGQYPRWRRAPNASQYPNNLFTILGARYELNVSEPLTGLCPETLCTGGPDHPSLPQRLSAIATDLSLVYLHILLPEDWARGLPPVFGRLRDFRGAKGDGEGRPDPRSDREWLYSRFLQGIRDDGRPTLHFAHVNLPHHPFRYLPSGRRYDATDERPYREHPAYRGSDEDWEMTQLLQRHLLQTGFVDNLLGRLRDRLAHTGLTDRALLIVTSDHGESFRPGSSSRDVDWRNAGDILPVPLFVKLPGQHEGTVSDRNVETIDILPTIIEVLGGEVPAAMDGRSVFDAGARDREWKVVYARRSRDGPWRRVRLQFPNALPSRADTVRWIFATFNFVSNPDPLFAIGPHGDLVGRPVAALPIEEPSTLAARLTRPSLYDDVEPAPEIVPAHVAGELEGPAISDQPLVLAVAVNGVIHAVTHSYDHLEGTARFSAMVPERAFRPGRNLLEIFALQESPLALQSIPRR